LGEHMDYVNQPFPSFHYRAGGILLPRVDFQEPLSVEIAHFLDCIENGTKCIAGVEHAERMVAILASATDQQFR
ncbi:MAG: gfo/Idh/MocA family oxidoreductase, partial [Deltaproteobacteria bacterium]